MALRKCSECGNQVSTTAAACPKCGARIDVALATKKGSAKRGRVWLVIIVALGGYILLPAIFRAFSVSPPSAPVNSTAPVSAVSTSPANSMAAAKG